MATTISECKGNQTLKQMGRSSKISRLKQLLSVKDWKLKSLFTHSEDKTLFVSPLSVVFNITAYQFIIADHVHSLMITVYPSSGDKFQQDNATCHKAAIEHVKGIAILSDLWSPDHNRTEML